MPDTTRPIIVVTAGGPAEAPRFSARADIRWKALLPYGAGILLHAALDAARGLDPARVVLVADPEVAALADVAARDVLPASADGRGSLATALACGEPDAPLVLVTCDLPYIDAASLAEFYAAARASTADAAMPLAEARAYEDAYPGAPDGCTRVGRDRVANGCVFYFRDGRAALRASLVAQRLFAARKSLWAMARLLSPPLLLRFALGTLTIAHVEAYARRRFGLRAIGLRGMSPRLCFDVDDEADYRYALAHPRA